MDLVLNNLQGLICHKTQPTNLQETSERYTPNYRYENFVTTYIEAAAECIPSILKETQQMPGVSLWCNG